MLPSLEFSLQLWVAAEQRGALLEALPGVRARLPHALTARGVDAAAAVLTHVTDADSEARPCAAAPSCMCSIVTGSCFHGQGRSCQYKETQTGGRANAPTVHVAACGFRLMLPCHGRSLMFGTGAQTWPPQRLPARGCHWDQCRCSLLRDPLR